MNLGSDPDLKAVITIVARAEQRFNTTQLAVLTKPYAEIRVYKTLSIFVAINTN